MSNLLEKASILTTPTAYDDGKILSVKPSKVIGEELVTNGTFDTDTDWNKDDSWTISGGKANYSYISGRNLNSSTATLIVGRIYQIEYDILDYVSGSVENSSAETQISNNSNGTYTEVFTARYTFLRFRGSTNGEFSIDNVSVKEVIDGDFDFTRNSSATRVNAQGLVEDVQILSSNLVSNGDFSQEGSEQITNGGFDTDLSGWTYSSGVTWNNGKAQVDALDGSFKYIEQIITSSGTKTYKISFDISNIQGSVQLTEGTSLVTEKSTNGTFEVYYKTTTTNPAIQFKRKFGTNTFFELDNVSVKEVGQDWILGTGITIEENKAIFTSTASGQSVSQNAVASSLTNGALAKVSFEVLTRTEGSFGVYFSGTLVGTLASAGVFTAYFTKGTETSFYIRALGTTSGSISNISVIEITDDTNLPRINYDGFSYQDALGSELVTNGDFTTDSNWSKINSTISDGTGNLNGTGVTSMLYQNILTNGKTYKVTFTVSDYNSLGEAGIIKSSGSAIYTITSNGTFTFIFTHSDASGNFLFRARNGAILSIDNVSVKEYLGQEVVPDSGVGSWLFEPQSTNLVTYSEDFSDVSWLKEGGATIELDADISPSGSINASYLKAPLTTNATIRVGYSFTSTASQTYVGSVFVKKQNIDFIRILSTGATSSTLQAFYNVSNGTLGTSGTPSKATIEDYGNGWYRLNLIIDAVNTTSDATFRVQLAKTDGAVINDFDGTEKNLIWGAQLEALSYPTSYIPTEGSIKTRLQDAAFGAGSSDLINSTEGVLYAEIAALSDGVGTRTISVSDGTNNNSIAIRYTTNSGIVNAFIVSGGFIQFSANISGVSVLDFNKVAIKYSLNDMALWINGVEVATDINGTMPLGLNEINFTRGDGANKFFGKTKCLAVFKEALTDEELTCLTTI